jgi:uncharacterized membrane protein
MTQPQPDSTDQQLDITLGRLLQIGVLLAAMVVLVGAVVYLARFGSADSENHVFHGEPPELRDPLQIIRGALELHPRRLIQLGLLLLVAVPVARVAFTVMVFAKKRDWTYVVFTLIVLSLLLFSLFWGS